LELLLLLDFRCHYADVNYLTSTGLRDDRTVSYSPRFRDIRDVVTNNPNMFYDVGEWILQMTGFTILFIFFCTVTEVITIYDTLLCVIFPQMIIYTRNIFYHISYTGSDWYITEFIIDKGLIIFHNVCRTLWITKHNILHYLRFGIQPDSLGNNWKLYTCLVVVS